MLLHHLPFLSLAALAFISTVAFGATLPYDEVQALKDIANTLGKRNWNFSADPCSGKEGWADQNPDKGFENAVTCNCTYAGGTVCHVVNIILKSQNLPGRLPPELTRLPFLQEIDLTRNYLNGTIPSEWASLPLVNVSLYGNRLTDAIPKAFASISTLANLTLEFNQFSGDLPAELGNLINLEKLHLNSNNFTGKLPESFANLTRLKHFRISDNHFTGQIPDYIQNWTKLERLFIEGSGLAGPIPSGIASLVELTDLRISDLNGPEGPFPRLSNLKNMNYLILRSCNIIGELPEYLGQMIGLRVLDLSFNKLSGVIPSNFSGSGLTYMYLTGNLLTGPVPDWIVRKRNKHIDLSYNNFIDGSSDSNCENQSVNLFASSSEGSNSTGIVSCLKSFTCPTNHSSLHINCGGKQVIANGSTTFEDDLDAAGPSRFFISRTNWAFSTTGHFIDNSTRENSYIQINTSRLLMDDSQLYTEARISPISLTYYGYCMVNGNYTVNLHFAEILFTDDKSYCSLGRRIFDVYIQGKLVLKDFNIENEAGGVGKAIVKPFSAAVTNGTMEIRLYWAGKGTTDIPYKGVYGPLISAISLYTPDIASPLVNGSSNSTNVGMVVGIVAAAAFILILIVSILWWKGCFKRKHTLEQELKGLDLHTGSFTLRQIKAATNNFAPDNKIGEGGFGPVYKGLLADGKVIAVKQLSSKSKQGNREFVNEIGMISALQHPNLVKLYGCCIEGNQLLLIYEYMENNSLARALFGPEEHRLKLDWPTRHSICIGLARGLAYLHEESRLKIVHRDIKATNVLLDKDLNPKISDFGLAKLDEEDNTHISTRIAGTFGYMAPEYAMRGYLTDKADVYSFGIVALEIVSGRSNVICRTKEAQFCLLDWALVLKEQGHLMELVDPHLGSNFVEEQVMVMINVALLCADVSPTNRPLMSSVVSMLEGRVAVPDFIPDSSISNMDETKSQAMRKYYQFSTEQSGSHTQSKPFTGSSTSAVDKLFTGSSASAVDLYPVNSDRSWE
ncbi:probable leucine-rich repeat receptor-like serine/threonine-protein kinase At3g14840 isoform X1 [Citrus sinensis]|uniref:probable leucine-rich repeat receptor-like serine/threonine-protein kinase At3g14840 isoform X1 n=1 Tax=Citrus sinensis TaxID=2711 RepID=UPI0022777E40|nr:probable leucine-rich repeat receptor-like serine/threonine-protein kinase At3g14840 isoform X1 [Citrus sinensis]